MENSSCRGTEGSPRDSRDLGRYHLFCTDAVCAESCDVAYLSMVRVTAKLTPIKTRKPRAKRMKEPVGFMNSLSRLPVDDAGLFRFLFL